MKISVIIPSRNEQDTLERTLRDLQQNIVGDTDVHIILDRWKPEQPIEMNDNRFYFHYFEEGIGQRGGMNWVVERYVSDVYFKLDAHCAVSPGFDDGLRETFQELGGSPTVVPIMYNLDVKTWLPKEHKKTTQMYMAVEKGDLRALYYGSRQKPEEPEGDYIDTMACMGPGWAVKRDWFIKTGMCDVNSTGQAGWGAQSVEVSCKAWLSGERLVTTKKCWFAHYFRGHVGFPFPVGGREVDRVRKYHTDLWLNDKWEHRHPDRTWNWLLDKFNPPGWNSENMPIKPTDISKDRMQIFAPMYKQIQRKKNLPHWKGIPIMKFPSDLTLYQEVIARNKPDFIVEIGTNKGGSALYFQDMLDIYNPGGQVITVDVKKIVKEWDPRITYILGDGKSDEVIDQIKSMVGDKSVMVILDGDHRRVQVKWELYKYRHITTPGQYMVAEDCYIDRGAYGPKEAVDWFLDRHKGWEYVDESMKYLVGITMGGWLLKK